MIICRGRRKPLCLSWRISELVCTGKASKEQGRNGANTRVCPQVRRAHSLHVALRTSCAPNFLKAQQAEFPSWCSG